MEKQSGINKLKQYNLIVRAYSVNWKHITDNPEKGYSIAAKQLELNSEFCELLKSTLEDGKCNAKSKREIYRYVMQTCESLCRESQKMLSNYSGYKELLDKGAKYVAGSNERATQVLTGIKNIDQVYKTVAGMQAMEASRIMGILDETIIHENPEYIALTKQVAQAFNDMWYAFGKRWVDFYLSPGEEFVKDHWGYYQEIIKGLPQKVIDTLDEKGWDLVLDDMARNHGKWQFKNQFIKERDEKRDMKRKQEQEEEDKKYWETHRAEYKRKLKLEKELKKLEQTISAKRENKLLLDKQRAPFRAEYFNISGQISEKYRDIARLEKKIFGKKKAKEEIAMIRKEIISLEDKNKAIDADIAGYNEAIQKLERAISDLQSRINDLQQQIVELRAHN